MPQKAEKASTGAGKASESQGTLHCKVYRPQTETESYGEKKVAPGEGGTERAREKKHKIPICDATIDHYHLRG